MGKKRATAEQRKAARERRRAVIAKFAALSQEEREAFSARAIVQPTGHRLSINNTCLVLVQNDKATMVAGLHDWNKAGRRVKKGQHGMMIFVPAFNETTEERALSDARYYIARYVFDIAQTEAANEAD